MEMFPFSSAQSLLWTEIERVTTPACLMTAQKITERQKPLVGSWKARTYSEFQAGIIMCSFAISQPAVQEIACEHHLLQRQAYPESHISSLLETHSPMQIDTHNYNCVAAFL